MGRRDLVETAVKGAWLAEGFKLGVRPGCQPWLSHLLAVPPQAGHLPPFSPLSERASRLSRKHGVISFSDCYLVDIMEMMLHGVDVRKALSRMPGTWPVPNKCYSHDQELPARLSQRTA